MGITHLSIELTLDLIALIIGIILIIRAKDNYTIIRNYIGEL